MPKMSIIMPKSSKISKVLKILNSNISFKIQQKIFKLLAIEIEIIKLKSTRKQKRNIKKIVVKILKNKKQ